MHRRDQTQTRDIMHNDPAPMDGKKKGSWLKMLYQMTG